MSVSYSVDLRQKVLAPLENEPSSNVVAARFGVSGSFVRKLRQKVEITGKVAAIPPPGKERFVDARGEAILRRLVEQRPDATLDALVRLFPRHGGRNATERERPDVIERRNAFQETQKMWNKARLICVDESGVNLSMTRSVAWSPVGQRAICVAPGGRWTNYSVIAGIGVDGLRAPMIISGAIDGTVTLDWVERCLALNRIEMAWSKLKTILRKLAPRTWSRLVVALGKALEAVTADDVIGWFKHSGYAIG
jgi:transposase